MVQRAAGGKIWKGGVFAPLLAVFVLLLQSIALAPCAAAASSTPAAHAAPHCAEAPTPRNDRRTPAPDVDGCCECLAAVAVPVLPQPPLLARGGEAASAVDLSSRLAAPALRAIASGPPSQAPPARV